MITIGLLGGIASGKSTVARLLAEHGAVVLDADQAAHEVLATDEVKAAIVGRWGDRMLTGDGQIYRRAIADRVFGPAEQAAADRQFLEGLVHPGVRVRLRGELADLAAGGAAAAVLDIPLLLESGYRDDCDLLLMVDSSREDRLARAERRGWSLDEFAWREAAQWSISEKQGAATDAVANRGSLKSLRAQVDHFWRTRVAPLG